jgi:hypothetical protein
MKSCFTWKSLLGNYELSRSIKELIENDLFLLTNTNSNLIEYLIIKIIK